MAAYADRTKLQQLGTSATSLTSVSEDAQDNALEFRSRFVDTFLVRAGYDVPLEEPVDEVIAGAVCVLAAYDCICGRGFQRASDQDKNIRERYLDILKWLETMPTIETDDTGSNNSDVPLVSSECNRGWSRTRVNF